MSAERARVMVFGAGVIGGLATDLLCRMDDRFEVRLLARDGERALERANLAAAVSLSLGFNPRVSAARADVTNLADTAANVAAYRPDLVINATSRQTFWKISTLPPSAYRQLAEARIGPWLPHHLATARALMLAVRASGHAPLVVNASFPDAVNVVLARIGLAPTTGAGNVGNAAPTLRRAAACLLHVPVEAITVRFVAHHVVGNAIASYGHTLGAPFLLQVCVDGEDVTHRCRPEAMFAAFVTHLRRTRGVPGQIMAASCVAATARALLSEGRWDLHVPGPGGLPGGYPAAVGGGEVTVTPPAGATLAQCVAVNEAAQVYEGILAIEADGSVRFAPEQMDVLTRAFGYRCEAMRPADVDAWADELDARYQRYAEAA